MTRAAGYAGIVGAAMFWGVSATIAKALFNDLQLDPVLVVQCRATFSFLTLLLYFVLVRPSLLRARRSDLGKFALLGCLGVAATNFTYYYTIRETTVATAILIQYVAPVLIVGYAVVTGEERITRIKVLSALISLAGCFLAVGAYDPSVLRITPLGLVTGIGSVIGFAFLIIYTRHVRRGQNTWTMTIYVLGAASLFWLLINPPWVAFQTYITPLTWLKLYVLAIVSLLIPNVLFFAAMRAVVPSRAIIISTLEPIVAIVSAAAFVGEALTIVQMIGAVVVIVAIVILQLHPEEEGGAESPAH